MSSFRPEGMICGPGRPVSGFFVAMTSPVNRTPRCSGSRTRRPPAAPGHTLARPERTPDARDEEHNAAGAAAVGLIANVLKGYRIEGDDMMLRAALHGFVALEAAGGFGLPQSVGGTFTRLVDSLHVAWSTWSTETGRG